MGEAKDKKRKMVVYTGPMGVAQLNLALIDEFNRQAGLPPLTEEQRKARIVKTLEEYPNGLIRLEF